MSCVFIFMAEKSCCVSTCEISVSVCNGQSDLGVVVVATPAESQHHGVPGQALQAGGTASLPGQTRLPLQHSLLDCDELEQQVQDVSLLQLPANNRNVTQVSS